MEAERSARAALVAISFIIFTSCKFAVAHQQTHDAKRRPRNQVEALNKLWKGRKLQNNSTIHSSLFSSALKQADMAAAKHPRFGTKNTDKILRLPGQPWVRFGQYGGYVTVDKDAGRALFYYFAEALPEIKDRLPLLLWLNGGPGCSSFGYGAMSELGPLRVHSDGKTLYSNPFAWNKVANVLFLESPAGTGFSYSETKSDYNTSGDTRTAVDTYVFLVHWLWKFPEYWNRDFYIAGESYAGHYVPQLARVILQRNKNRKNQPINLKGIMVGNGVLYDNTDVQGMFAFYGSHFMISLELARKIENVCDFSSKDASGSDECDAAASQAVNEVFGEEKLDIYNIYADLCQDGNLTHWPTKASISSCDPCASFYVYAYLNRPDVQKALHANVTNLPYVWNSCSEVISDWQDSATTVLPILKELMDKEISVWIFCGDVDGRVPCTSSQYSIDKMNLTIKKPWKAWYLHNEVAGYTQVYENLTFVTVKAAGHMVPCYKPVEALALVGHFLAGKLLQGQAD